ncbi:Cohesin subunit SA-1 [Hordeum vulgare]|nr:Cohesin subunit SA-1 [Hordeum vulgare]
MSTLVSSAPPGFPKWCCGGGIGGHVYHGSRSAVPMAAPSTDGQIRAAEGAPAAKADDGPRRRVPSNPSGMGLLELISKSPSPTRRLLPEMHVPVNGSGRAREIPPIRWRKGEMIGSAWHPADEQRRPTRAIGPPTSARPFGPTTSTSPSPNKMDKGKEVIPPLERDKVVVPPLVNVSVQDHPSAKRRSYHEEAGPTHFCKVIFAPKLEALPLPLDFTKHFPVMPMEFSLKMNSGCSWRVMVKVIHKRITLDQGWATFAAIHQVRVGHVVTFKLLTPNTMKGIISNDDGVKVVTMVQEAQ